MLAEIGSREYWKRTGHSFVKVEHFEIVDMVTRRTRADLCLDWQAVRGNARDNVHELRLMLLIKNVGRGVARSPTLEIDLKHPLAIFGPGFDGRGQQGLRWQDLGIHRHALQRHAFHSDAGQVVHPDVPLNVTIVLAGTFVRNVGRAWDFDLETITIPYRIAAEEAPARSDVLRIVPDDESRRIMLDLRL